MLPEPLKAIARSCVTAMRLDSAATARRKTAAYFDSRHGKPSGLHLGCGPHAMDGWLNVDLLPEHPQLVAWDLRKGMRFLPSESFDFVYHEHFFEHLDRRSARLVLEESLRVLKPGGRMRIAMPDLDRSIRRYLEGYADEEGEFADYRRALYGDQLLDTPGEALDLALRGWEHRFLYGERDITRMIELNGFTNIRRVAYRESDADALRGLETRSAEQSALIIEADKPSVTR